MLFSPDTPPPAPPSSKPNTSLFVLSFQNKLKINTLMIFEPENQMTGESPNCVFSFFWQPTLLLSISYINKLHYLTETKRCKVFFHFFFFHSACVCVHTVTGFGKSARISCLTTSINIETSSLSSNLRILSKYWRSGIEVHWSIPYQCLNTVTYEHGCTHTRAYRYAHTHAHALQLCSEPSLYTAGKSWKN